MDIGPGTNHVCMPANLVIVAGKKTRNSKKAMCNSVGQGVPNLLGYGCEPICEFSETAKIAASNLPLIKRLEEI
jgi:hypothetical protein